MIEDTNIILRRIRTSLGTSSMVLKISRLPKINTAQKEPIR